jgi:Nickel responsive protein SCO4226-like
MPKYIVFRTVGEVSEEQMEARMRSSIEAADQMPGVRWIRSYYSAEEGKIYCEYEAPSIEAIIEHAQRAGIPVDRAEVVRELEPSMFR